MQQLAGVKYKEKMSDKTNGKWINVSDGRPFGGIDLMVFQNKKIYHSLLESTENSLNLKENKEQNAFEEISELEFKFINPDRIRFYRKGKTYSVISENESITEDIIFEQDYVKLVPTISSISESRIQKLKYSFVWNNEKQVIEFNRILDKPEIQLMNRRQDREGTKILLEKLDETLFISMFHNKERGLVMPIKEISENKIILSGLPGEPFEIIGERIN